MLHLGMDNVMGLLSKHYSFDCDLLNITLYDWEPGGGVLDRVFQNVMVWGYLDHV